MTTLSTDSPDLGRLAAEVLAAEEECRRVRARWDAYLAERRIKASPGEDWDSIFEPLKAADRYWTALAALGSALRTHICAHGSGLMVSPEVKAIVDEALKTEHVGLPLSGSPRSGRASRQKARRGVSAWGAV